MKNLIETNEYGLFATKDGVAKINSRTVAEVFGKEHKNILRAIDRLECSDEFNQLNFEPSTYKDDRGRRQPCVDMTRDGFVFLVMGFTGKKAAQFKELYINQFNQMESFIKTFMDTRAEFPALTDNIKLMHEEPKSYHYSNEINMIYKIAIGMTAAQFRKEHGLEKGESIRPYLTEQEIEIVERLQRIDTGLVIAIPDYQERKQKLEWYRMRMYGVTEALAA